MALLACGACGDRVGVQTSPEQAQSNLFGRTGKSSERKSTGSSADVHLVELVFDIARIDVPVNDTHHLRKVWNHVDELRVGPDMVARLARNGLRVGAGSADDWPALRAVFSAANAEARRDQMVAQRGLPLTVHLGTLDGTESVFSYTSGGQLTGKSFSVGNRLMTVDYVYHPELGGSTELQLGFEIRHDRGVMTWEKRGGVIREVPAYDRHVFGELSVPLTLRAGEFLVIGPRDEAKNEYLIGGRFFGATKSGQRFETLLCITPSPYQIKVKRSR